MKAAISENVWMKDLEVIIEEKEVLDWQTAWRQHFKTFEIVPGIRVVPSWEADGGRTDENSIEMDPGMAFGTGLHETTRLCAEAIASLMADAWPRSLLDVGTGSGILAMIARRLGLTNIATVENDPVAREVAVQNFMKNSMGDITVARDIGAARGRFDIVVANILLSTILELRRELADKTATGGVLIVSGITSDQESDIEKAFCEGFRAISRKRQGEWSMIAFERGD
jgi:ribosomal protein L11 methyltransferase